MDTAEIEYWTTEQRVYPAVTYDTPGLVREFVRAVLTGRVAADPLWSALEIVNEMVINVVAHAGVGCEAVVRINVRSDRLALTVQDNGPGAIVWPPGFPAADADHGRGLPMISALASRIQVFTVLPYGKAVIAIIDL